MASRNYAINANEAFLVSQHEGTTLRTVRRSSRRMFFRLYYKILISSRAATISWWAVPPAEKESPVHHFTNLYNFNKLNKKVPLPP
jgi:hypothetical protein